MYEVLSIVHRVKNKLRSNRIRGVRRRMFKRGEPRAPTAGIKKGKKHAMTVIQEELLLGVLSDKAPLVLNKCIDMALKGNVNCIKMILDRMIPVKKAVEITGKDGNDIKIIIESLITHDEKKEEEIFEAEIIKEEKLTNRGDNENV